jgi:thioredoxin-like negative regulator of GroEL
VNTDAAPELAQDHDVRAVPTLIRFAEGKETGRLIGFRPRDRVRAFAVG